ncbi:protein kinase family protein [Nitzschia inconspicua]|uniref:Protein kinase family protein n=1 Tax=Nitzschia inconspicua TaxID=303405 RepID=A0A9K3KYJ2_9STRA|nr:protein kinase family protein [Nitzschia inconspicua]
MRFPEGKDPKKDITPALCITKEDFYTGLRFFCEQKKKDAGRFLDLDQGTNPPPKTRIERARTGQLFSPGDFEIVSRIQSDVFRVRLKSNPTGTYVMKVVTKHIKYILKYVMAEVVVESFIWHPNIVILWAYMFCFLNGQITTLLILQDGGQDLERTALSLNTEDKLGGISKLQDVLGYIVQTNWAIEALHTIGVLHRDIKPSNIVHNKDDPTQVVVIDFNCARLSALENGTQTVNIGTCGFVSGDNEGAAQDLFAMGQTAMVLSSGRTLNLLPQQERISHQLRAAFSDEVSDQLIDLYSKYLLYIMNPNASKRWSSLQALVGSSALQLFATRGGKGADSLHRLFESIDTLTAIKPKDHREPSDDWKAASNRLRGALIWMLNTKQVIGSIHEIDIGVQIGLEDELPSMDPFVVHEINGNFVNFCIAPETENLTEDKKNLNTNDGIEMQTVDVLSTAEHVDSTEATGGEVPIEVSSDALSTAKTPRRRNHGGRRRSVFTDTREVSKETLVNFIIPDLSTHGGKQTQDVVVLGTTDCQTIHIDDNQGPVGLSNKVGRLPPSASALRILRAFFCTIHKCFVFFLCSIGILNLVVGGHYASIYGSNLIWLPEYLKNGIQVLVTFQECTSEYGQIDIEYITKCSGVLLESAKDFWFTSSTGTEGVAAFDETSILYHRVLDEQHPISSCIAGMLCELWTQRN